MRPHEEINWGEVEDAAARIFDVWYLGSELEWAKEAWDHFGQAGLNNASGVIERTKVYLRLVTLGRIYHEFCGRAWDENPEWPISYFAEDLDIDPVALGMLAGKAGLDQSDYWLDKESDLREVALVKTSDGMRREIFDCLHRAYCSPENLYSRMWRTRDDDGSDDSEQRHVEEFDVTGSNVAALSYVQNGFQYGT